MLKSTLVPGVALALALFATVRGTAAPTASDPLWARASELATRSAGLFPSHTRTHTVVGDGKKTLETRDVVEALASWKEGKPVYEKKLTREGKDAGISITVTMDDGISPLLPANAARVTASRKADAVVAGRSCAVYDFEDEPKKPSKKDEGNVGTLFLDRETAEPVRLEFRPRKLPAHTSEFAVGIDYERDTEGRIVAKEMSLGLKGGFLFTKRTYEQKTTYARWVAAGVPGA